MRILGIVLAQDLQENVPRRNIAHIDRTFEASISATANRSRESAAWPYVEATAWPCVETATGLSTKATAPTIGKAAAWPLVETTARTIIKPTARFFGSTTTWTRVKPAAGGSAASATCSDRLITWPHVLFSNQYSSRY
jgi:hypothetical protein